MRGWDSNPRLELMRLARKAAPPPRVAQVRRSGRLESNQRSPVPETGGVTVSPTARRKNPRRDSNPRFRAENPASLPLDHGGMKVIGGPGIEPGPARYQRAVPPRTPTSEKKGSGGRARTCSSRLTV